MKNGGHWFDLKLSNLLLKRSGIPILLVFLIGIVGGGVQLGPLGTVATNRPIVPAPGDYDGEICGMMIGRGNRSTRRKPAPVPLCPPHTPHACLDVTRPATVGSQRLTVWAMAWPILTTNWYAEVHYQRSKSVYTFLLNISHGTLRLITNDIYSKTTNCGSLFKCRRLQILIPISSILWNGIFGGKRVFWVLCQHGNIHYMYLKQT
jgi:hypothetical protein